MINIQLCKAKVPVTRVGPRTPTTSKMKFFVAIIKELEMLNIVPKSSIIDIKADMKNKKV